MEKIRWQCRLGIHHYCRWAKFGETDVTVDLHSGGEAKSRYATYLRFCMHCNKPQRKELLIFGKEVF